VFGHSGYRQEFGLNARYGITQNVLLDATINPDFSQIESDADQITANERFAISYPEKRPFFLEGADLFQTPHRLVYTRSIVEPAAGAKLTGKLGAFKAGYLGAYDDSPRGAPDNAKAFINLLRLRRDLGNASTIGLLYTDRTLGRNQGFNRVASVDARLVLAQRYTLNAQFAESWTRTDAGTTNAPLWSAALLRSGRTFGFHTVLEGIDRDFQAQSGFIQRRGDARAFLQARTTYFNQPQSWIQKYEIAAQAEGFFNEDRIWSMNRPREGEIELHPGIYFRNNSNLRAILRIGYFEFDETDFADWQRTLPDGTPAGYTPPLELRNLLGLALLPSLRPTQRVQIGGRMYLREVPIYAEASRGLEVQLAPELRLWPSDGLTVELHYAYSRLRRTNNDSRFSSQDITRFKAQYQFSKALMARFFVQYNLNERDAIRDAVDGRPVIIDGAVSSSERRTDFGGNVLLQYEPSPGTIFYLGYTRQLQGFERTYDYSRLDPVSDGVFLKFSYLYRL
ncbi:MAG TPA: DUF5916 domain-containing protein, partial [Longimicrobiales bacterium]|nr:DUF5916 domain-containing protein [Longimicrobiales bacterium]